MAVLNDIKDRKAFNFYRSYWEVGCELPDVDRLAYYDAILKQQFTSESSELSGMAKFAYISQRHSIESQVKGYQTNGLRENIVLPSPTPSAGASAGGHEGASEQEKEKEKEKGKLESKKEIFESFRILYPGKKRGLDTEFQNLTKQHKDWQSVIEKLKPTIEVQIKQRNAKILKKEWVPEWKNLQTWINKRCWEEVMPSSIDPQAPVEEIYEWRMDAGSPINRTSKEVYLKTKENWGEHANIQLLSHKL